jgi:transcriptional regulator with XRE-family HTH domain
MTDIGNSIRRKREELGFTLEEICEKTKISVVQLNAIENGDMDHFKHDMVFLRFYLKNLCVVLGLDFNDVAHQFNITKDEFTNTLSLKKIRENEISEANDANNKRLSDNKYIYRNFKKKRFEVSFVTLIIVIAIIVIGLTFVFFTSILPILTVTPKVIGNNPITQIPGEITMVENPKPNPDANPNPTQIVITKTGLTSYMITDWVKDNQVKFVLSFKTNSYIRVFIDGVVTNNPAARKYLFGETMEIITNATANREVQIAIGYMKMNTITVNGQNVVIDPAIANLPKSYKVTFTFSGSTS